MEADQLIAEFDAVSTRLFVLLAVKAVLWLAYVAFLVVWAVRARRRAVATADVSSRRLLRLALTPRARWGGSVSSGEETAVRNLRGILVRVSLTFVVWAIAIAVLGSLQDDALRRLKEIGERARQISGEAER